MKAAASLTRAGGMVTLFIVLVFTLTACWGGGEEAAPTPAADAAPVESARPVVGQPATLQCSEACASRGHCGITAERQPYVLLDRDGPVAASGLHDMAVPAGSTVTVGEIRTEMLVFASGVEQPHDFFRVFIPTRNEAGWVANWCLVSAQ